MSDIVCIDFESYHDQDYNLSKMTTEAYVRDPRFEVIGFSYKINDGEPKWVTGMPLGELKLELDKLDLPNRTVLAHNTAFDGFILAEIFGIHPKFLLDTLSMARPIHSFDVGGSLSKLAKKYGLGEKGTEVIKALGKHRLDFTPDELEAYGDYCSNDVTLCHKLYGILKQFTPDRELYIIDLMLRMFTDPVLVLDKELLETHKYYIHTRKNALLLRVESLVN